jgi:uncharacterized protein YdaU (DUF1376 family)
VQKSKSPADRAGYNGAKTRSRLQSSFNSAARTKQAWPFMQIPIGEYFAQTMTLTRDQHGAMFLLMLAAWNTPGCTLPNDEKLLARITQCSPAQWRRIKPAIIALWEETDDGLHLPMLSARRSFLRAKIAHRFERKTHRKNAAFSTQGPEIPQNVSTKPKPKPEAEQEPTKGLSKKTEVVVEGRDEPGWNGKPDWVN